MLKMFGFRRNAIFAVALLLLSVPHATAASNFIEPVQSDGNGNVNTTCKSNCSSLSGNAVSGSVTDSNVSMDYYVPDGAWSGTASIVITDSSGMIIANLTASISDTGGLGSPARVGLDHIVPAGGSVSISVSESGPNGSFTAGYNLRNYLPPQ